MSKKEVSMANAPRGTNVEKPRDAAMRHDNGRARRCRQGVCKVGLKAWLVGRFTRWLVKEQPLSDMPLCDFDRLSLEIRPCDVLLVEGRSRVSNIIKNNNHTHNHSVQDTQRVIKYCAHHLGAGYGGRRGGGRARGGGPGAGGPRRGR